MKPDFSPLVSIITPTFNQERYIGECIESVLRQTYAHWEQIIIDDGSTDGTAKVIERYKDPRIRYFYQENQGALELAKTYDRALSLAKGELIAILEGDDFWPQDKLATLVPGFLDADVVLAYGEVSDVNAQGSEQRRISRSTRRWRVLPRSVLFNDPVGSATRYMLLSEGRALVGPSTVIVRRRALEDMGGFQYVQGLPTTDYPTFIELSLKGKFFYVAATMGYCRRHLGSVTTFHLERMDECVSSFSVQFLERNSAMIFLTPAQRAEIDRSWQKSGYKREFSQGRFLLARKQWQEGRVHFRVAWRSKEPSVRLAAIIGYLFSWLHLDVEPLMRLAGRADLHERM
jgi:glycosyltransferase involved in cell wall biosynthesis